MEDPTRTSFGDISPQATADLRAFSFLIGKWQGEGRTRLPDGGSATFPVTWIGRYVLDGTAIADEMQAPAPDGSPWLGMSLRQFDAARRTWIIEFLNLTGAFLRRQVNATSGSVTLDGRNVTVASASPGMRIREHYLVTGSDSFTYRLDISTDDGQSWTEGQMELSMMRAE